MIFFILPDWISELFTLAPPCSISGDELFTDESTLCFLVPPCCAPLKLFNDPELKIRFELL